MKWVNGRFFCIIAEETVNYLGLQINQEKVGQIMIEQLFHDIYKIEIPLPHNPLKATNAYFIRGGERNLLIDTGFNQPACKEAMDQAMGEIGFSMADTDLFITHIHSDHSGLVGYLAQPGTRVYAGKYCARHITGQGRDHLAYFRDYIVQSGLGEMGLRADDMAIHPGIKFETDFIPRAAEVLDGDMIQAGDLALRCVETGGHAPDHMCLYQADRKILFAGDHILYKITPNNTIWETPWEAKTDYLAMYLRNLDKIASLEVQWVLPGHRAVFQDCRSRIAELKSHHQKRLDHILEILEGNKLSGAEVAARMQWDIRAKSWDDFPAAQKFFATGEALSHLAHLTFLNRTLKEYRDGVVYYSIA